MFGLPGHPSPIILDIMPAWAAERLLLRSLRKAVLQGASDTQLCPAYEALARIAQRRGDNERAIMLLKRALDADPIIPSFCHFELARCYKVQGDYKAAALQLRAAEEKLEPGVSVEFRATVAEELRECTEKAQRKF